MKKDNNQFVTLVLLIVVVILMSMVMNLNNRATTDTKIDILKYKIDSLHVIISTRDSLHTEHMKKCSYIDKKGVYITDDGYIKTYNIPSRSNQFLTYLNE